MRDRLFTLTRKQRKDMEGQYRQTSERRIGERIQAILLLDAGRTAREVAEILRVHPKTIKRWVKIFAEHGRDDLVTLKYEGQDGLLTRQHREQFELWLDEQIRSTKEAIAYVEQAFSVSYGESGMVKLLARLGYSYKKPAQGPSKADPDEQARWVAEYGEKRGP
jgi:transposase